MNKAESRLQRPGKPEQFATRLIFLLCGIGQSAWAPLVPYAKARVHANDQQFGLLLLCFGLGSIVAMPTMGALAARFGCKRLIQITVGGLCLSFLSVSIAPTTVLLAASLISFGAFLGSLDVVMNVQALLVEKASGENLMPGFHALYSVGGISGAVLMSGLIWIGTPIGLAALMVVMVLAGLLAIARGSLLTYAGEQQGHRGIAWPNRHVLLIGALAFLMMLVEGSMLDWSAVFLVDGAGMLARHAGIGYTAFSIAMTLSRFGGSRMVTRFGRTRVIVSGALLAATGFIVAVLVPGVSVAVLGFVLIGLGAANLVPLFFSLASEAKGSLGGNVSFVTTFGYSGILAGPALIGFVVHRAGFPVAFGGIAFLLLLVALLSRAAIAGTSLGEGRIETIASSL